MLGEDFPKIENMSDFQLPWRGQAIKRADGFFHITICNNRPNFRDKGRRLSFDLDDEGLISNIHGTDQNTGRHPISYFRAPSLEEYKNILDTNPDALGGAQSRHAYYQEP